MGERRNGWKGGCSLERELMLGGCKPEDKPTQGPCPKLIPRAVGLPPD